MITNETEVDVWIGDLRVTFYLNDTVKEYWHQVFEEIYPFILKYNQEEGITLLPKHKLRETCLPEAFKFLVVNGLFMNGFKYFNYDRCGKMAEWILTECDSDELEVKY